MTRVVTFAIVVALAACGSSQHPDHGSGSGSAGAGSAEPVVRDTRTAIEQRRDKGCELLQPKLTECAIADAKKTMTKAELDQLRPEELRGRHKQKFLEECKGSAMSSRQVRVLEVCYKSETECDPLAECLKHLAPEKSEK